MGLKANRTPACKAQLFDSHEVGGELRRANIGEANATTLGKPDQQIMAVRPGCRNHILGKGEPCIHRDLQRVAPAEIEDDVIPFLFINEENVTAASANENVIAGPAVEYVISRAAVQHVVASKSFQTVAIGIPGDFIVQFIAACIERLPAVQQQVFHVGGKPGHADAGDDAVLPAIRCFRHNIPGRINIINVIACSTRHLVVAAPTLHEVVSGSTFQVVIAGQALDDLLRQKSEGNAAVALQNVKVVGGEIAPLHALEGDARPVVGIGEAQAIRTIDRELRKECRIEQVGKPIASGQQEPVVRRIEIIDDVVTSKAAAFLAIRGKDEVIGPRTT